MTSSGFGYSASGASGSQTTEFGESGATVYCRVGTSPVANTGNSGRKGTSTDPYSNTSGSSGIVIMRNAR